MKARFTVCFRARDYDGALGEAVLEYDLPFAPTPEVEFEHPVWGGALRPTLVIFDLDSQSFLVTFGIEELETKDRWQSEVELYQKHGWTVKGTSE